MLIQRYRNSAPRWGGGVGGRERAHTRPLAALFMFFFSFPLGLPYANWAQTGALLYLKCSLVLEPSFDLPLVYFHGLYPSMSFSHPHFGLFFPILTT